MADAVYSREQVERWQERLEKISQLPRTTFTKKQVVEELIVSIEQALKTRSYQEVAQELAADGLEISAGSLKQYVSKFRRSQSSKTSVGSRKRLGKSKVKKRAAGEGAEARAKVSDAKDIADKNNQEKPAANNSGRTTSSRFIEMDEDL
ncbi:MAG: hypothetical protein AAFR18_12010 [Cyanobacteria bacterium J06627_32]